MPGTSVSEFSAVASTISSAIKDIASTPVIPREIEDILSISNTERRRWLADGRLPSAGTRTVRLTGRAKKITFHVFDPRVVEDILDRDLVDVWREEDAERAAENRRLAAWKAKLTPRGLNADRDDGEEERIELRGWAEFERDGPLR